MIEKKILDTINKYKLIEPNDSIIVAVSGGPDSMCLLNALYDLKDKLKIEKIIVAHVNHMLRDEADDETKFVQRYCDDKKIKFYSKYVNIKEISKKNKTGEEETGRKERYAFFEEICIKENANKIAIAHNYNDNAETVLFHMIRGSGISGLGGIKPIAEGKYIRPLLKCQREEIEKYCMQKKLNPVHDKSNDDNTYTRNKIRNILIPYLEKEFNPNIIETINRLSESVLIEAEYIDNISRKIYNEICIYEKKNILNLDLKKFNHIDNAIKPKIILLSINKILGNVNGISKKHIDDIIKLCNNNIGNKYLTPNKNIKVFVKSGVVSFEKVLK